jgi:hypothetical protein
MISWRLIWDLMGFVCRIQLGQPATVKVAANLVRLLSYSNKVGLISILAL